MAETHAEVAYAGGPNRYMGDQRFQQPQWNQGAPRNPPPYRAPGHPERDQQKDQLQIILEEMRRNQGTINNQFQNINTKLGEIDVWRKSVDTQIGQLAASVPRQSGTLPGSSEPNPKGKTDI